MHAGHIVEVASTRAIFKQPKQPYTRALLSSIPRYDGSQVPETALHGQAPDVFSLRGEGCRFAGRCPDAMGVCALKRPPMVQLGDGHSVFCHLYADER